MPKKTYILCCLFLLTSVTPALAQLSANPWTRPNEEEQVQQVYKRRKQMHGSVTSYTPEEETVIDRSSAYIEVSDDDEASEDASMLDKFKNKFKKKETHLVANTAENREALARRRSMSASRTNSRQRRSASSTMQSMGLGDLGNMDFSLPSGSFDGLINKAKSSLRSIANQIK